MQPQERYATLQQICKENSPRLFNSDGNLPHGGRQPRCSDLELIAHSLFQESLNMSSERYFFSYLSTALPSLALQVGTLRNYNIRRPRYWILRGTAYVLFRTQTALRMLCCRDNLFIFLLMLLDKLRLNRVLPLFFSILFLLSSCDKQALPLDADEAQRELEEIIQEVQREDSWDDRDEMLKLLADFSVSHDVASRSGAKEWTLLHLSCRHRKPALVEWLLKHGADPNALCSGNYATVPLVITVSSGPVYSESEESRVKAYHILALLLAHGADADAENASGIRAPLELCTHTEDSYPVSEAMFILLLEHGADIESAAARPYTAEVAEKGWVNALRKLLELDAPMERKGARAIHGAARGAANRGTLECARILLAAGDNVYMRDHFKQYNSLMWLICSETFPKSGDAELTRCGEMVLLFLEAGANLEESWHMNEADFSGVDTPGYKIIPWKNNTLHNGKTIKDVLKELRPELSAWLTARGVKM